MTTLKLTQIGNSLGVIDAADGVMPTPYDPDLDQQLAIGREFMREYRGALHVLAR